MVSSSGIARRFPLSSACSLHRKRPRHQAGCHRNRSRPLGCRRIRIRKSRPVRCKRHRHRVPQHKGQRRRRCRRRPRRWCSHRRIHPPRQVGCRRSRTPRGCPSIRIRRWLSWLERVACKCHMHRSNPRHSSSTSQMPFSFTSSWQKPPHTPSASSWLPSQSQSPDRTAVARTNLTGMLSSIVIVVERRCRRSRSLLRGSV